MTSGRACARWPAIASLQIPSVAVPALGSGLGGLDWEDVREVIQDELSGLEDINIMVYEPYPRPLAPIRNTSGKT